MTEKTYRGVDGEEMHPRLRAFWVTYPEHPVSHRREAWAAHTAKELVGLLNAEYPAEHTLGNVEELTDEELLDCSVLDCDGDTVAELLGHMDEPGRLFELYSPDLHHPSGPAAK